MLKNTVLDVVKVKDLLKEFEEEFKKGKIFVSKIFGKKSSDDDLHEGGEK